jgi:NAD(P) transhydrogenase
LTDDCTPYEIGIAHFKEIFRSHIMGEEEGILKLLFYPETLKILGIHIIGSHTS